MFHFADKLFAKDKQSKESEGKGSKQRESPLRQKSCATSQQYECVQSNVPGANDQCHQKINRPRFKNCVATSSPCAEFTAESPGIWELTAPTSAELPRVKGTRWRLKKLCFESSPALRTKQAANSRLSTRYDDKVCLSACRPFRRSHSCRQPQAFGKCAAVPTSFIPSKRDPC